MGPKLTSLIQRFPRLAEKDSINLAELCGIISVATLTAMQCLRYYSWDSPLGL